MLQKTAESGQPFDGLMLRVAPGFPPIVTEPGGAVAAERVVYVSQLLREPQGSFVRPARP